MKLFSIESYRWWLLGIAGVVTAGVFLLGRFVHPGYLSALCGDIYPHDPCWQFWSEVADGVFNSSFFLKSIIITSILLMFFPERAFKWWRWFAIISIPLTIWDIVTTKTILTMVGTSPQFTANHDGVLFLSLSMTIALMSVLLGKVKQHTFTSNNSRVGAYVGSVLVSIAFGASIAAVLLMRYL